MEKTTSQALHVEDVHKSYGTHEVLKGISLTARKGDVISLIGASGSGKSTFLRCINFLEIPDRGRFIINDEEVVMKQQGGGRAQPANWRQIERIRTGLAMVFQSFNLWAHMTVLENVIEAPVHVLRMDRKEAVAKAEDLLQKVWSLRKKACFSGVPVRRPAATRIDRPRALRRSGCDAV